MKTNKKIAVIGLGYVGLPLAVEFGKKFQAIGFDTSKKRIKELKSNKDITLELKKEEIQSAKYLEFSNNINDINDCQIYIITVPTPIDSAKRPNLEPIKKASEAIGSILKKGDIVIYESTVYPGCTEEFCVPILENASQLKFNIDFFCGYSPERINPGDKVNTLNKITKITSGSTREIANEIDSLYKCIISAGTYLTPSIKVAEAAKVIENTQRDLNIALVNELSVIFEKLDIDTLEVLEAAGSKWNFLPFRPGLVGGHCIGVDPYYLTHKAEQVGYNPEVILAGRRINDNMAEYLVHQVVKHMSSNGIDISNSVVGVMGITFKENCPDIRNTKVVDIIEELKDFGCQVDVYDPWVDKEEEKRTYKHGLIKDPFQSNKKYAAIIVAVAHNQFIELTENDFTSISEGNPVLIDIKGIVENPSWRL